MKLSFNCKGPHRAGDCPKPKLECFHFKRLENKQNKYPDKNKQNHSDNINEVI